MAPYFRRALGIGTALGFAVGAYVVLAADWLAHRHEERAVYKVPPS